MSLTTVGMLAQNPAQPPTPQQDTPSSSDKKITVTGCLKAAPSMAADTASAASPNTTGAVGTAGSVTPEATGTTGTSATPTAPATPPAAPAGAKFILTAATASAAEAANGATAANAAQTYRLIANATALAEHVGKKLELTGTLDLTSTADPKDPSAAAPAFRVESGKIVAASCSE